MIRHTNWSWCARQHLNKYKKKSHHPLFKPLLPMILHLVIRAPIQILCGGKTTTTYWDGIDRDNLINSRSDAYLFKPSKKPQVRWWYNLIKSIHICSYTYYIYYKRWTTNRSPTVHCSNIQKSTIWVSKINGAFMQMNLHPYMFLHYFYILEHSDESQLLHICQKRQNGMWT